MLSIRHGTHKEKKGDSSKAIAIIYGPKPSRDGDMLFLDTDKQSTGEEIELKQNEKFALEPSHDPEGRDVIMVGGKSGSGKSYIAKNFIKRYKGLWPKREVRLVSYLEEDETIDEAKGVERIDPETWVDEPPELDYFKETLLVLDDIEGFERSNKHVFQAIQRVVDMVATTGRHSASSILNCSHLLTDYKRTRLWLGESNQFCIFPNGASLKQLNTLLGSYAGADSKEIKKMRYLPSRWVCLRTSFPPVVIHETGAYLLHDDRKVKKRKRDESGLFNKPKPEPDREGEKGEESESSNISKSSSASDSD
jgi:hypothetical protein